MVRGVRREVEAAASVLASEYPSHTMRDAAQAVAMTMNYVAVAARVAAAAVQTIPCLARGSPVR